jgi:uncharacterized protein YjbJ (UPF0337 family)
MSEHSHWQQVAGKWKQYGRAIKKRWDKLTDDEVTQINGRHEKLSATLQQKYGIDADAANKQIDDWANSLKL